MLHILYQGACISKADIVLVIDHSGSINHVDPGNWDRIRQFIDLFIKNLTIGQDAYHVAVVGYGKQSLI